jgi:hypothetical protein
MSKTIQINEETKLVSQVKGSRRSFLKFGGAAIATTGILVSGCQELVDLIPDKLKPGSQPVNLGSGDIGVLNYAYALEQLEAAFYTKVVEMPYSGISSEEEMILEDLRKHEVAHRNFLKAALGNDAIMMLTFDFKSVDFKSRDSVLATAKTFEDLGVAAYNGAGKLLKSADLLLIAGKIVSVEGRHAAAIRSISGSDPKSFAGDDVIDENGLDRAFDPQTVLDAAAPFIVNEIIADQLPQS